MEAQLEIVGIRVRRPLERHDRHSEGESHSRKATQCFSEVKLLDVIQEVGLRSEPKRTVHLLRSRAAADICQITRRPEPYCPCFHSGI